MLGSFPCQPGFQGKKPFENVYFYCSNCDGIVAPHELTIVEIDRNSCPKQVLSVLRCKKHNAHPNGSSNSLTTLWAVRRPPGRTEETENLSQCMGRLAQRVARIDYIAISTLALSGLFVLASVIIGGVIAVTCLAGIPTSSIALMLLSLAAMLFLLGTFFANRSKQLTQAWLQLSKDYLTHSELIQIQKGTECYIMTTQSPPTCFANRYFYKK